MRKIIPVEEAVGMVLPHDITEIVKDQKKGVAFRKGHIIRPEDIDPQASGKREYLRSFIGVLRDP